MVAISDVIRLERASPAAMISGWRGDSRSE